MEKCNNCGTVNPNKTDNCNVCGYLLTEHMPKKSYNFSGISQDTNSNIQLTKVSFFDTLGYKLFLLRTIGLDQIEGTIIGTQQLVPESHDFDTKKMFLKILLFLDIFLISGVIFLLLVSVSLFLAVIAAIFSIGCFVPLLGLFGKVLSFALIPSLFKMFRKNEKLVPVSNYTIQLNNHNTITVRLKGQLQGAIPQNTDEVRIWGKYKNKILHFHIGENTVSNEPYLFPFNWSGIGLVIVFIINIVTIIWASNLYNQINLY